VWGITLDLTTFCRVDAQQRGNLGEAACIGQVDDEIGFVDKLREVKGGQIAHKRGWMMDVDADVARAVVRPPFIMNSILSYELRKR
jgi:hypothetical protein